MQTEPVVTVVNRVLSAHKGTPGALLPVLHAVQDALGYVPPDAVAAIAQALNLSRAEVHGVVTYYHHFRSEPAGSNVVQICRAEACQAMGAERLWKQACDQLGGEGTRADGSVTLESVYCLGLCASSPALSINDRPFARVSSEKLAGLLRSAGSKA